MKRYVVGANRPIPTLIAVVQLISATAQTCHPFVDHHRRDGAGADW